MGGCVCGGSNSASGPTSSTDTTGAKGGIGSDTHCRLRPAHKGGPLEGGSGAGLHQWSHQGREVDAHTHP